MNLYHFFQLSGILIVEFKEYLSIYYFKSKKNEVEELHKPKFLRVLGYSPLGKLYLNEIKKKVTLYTNIKEGMHPVLDIELKITKLLDLIYSSNTLKEEQGKTTRNNIKNTYPFQLR